jgi:hypothetical protein
MPFFLPSGSSFRGKGRRSKSIRNLSASDPEEERCIYTHAHRRRERERETRCCCFLDSIQSSGNRGNVFEIYEGNTGARERKIESLFFPSPFLKCRPVPPLLAPRRAACNASPCQQRVLVLVARASRAFCLPRFVRRMIDTAGEEAGRGGGWRSR